MSQQNKSQTLTLTQTQSSLDDARFIQQEDLQSTPSTRKFKIQCSKTITNRKKIEPFFPTQEEDQNKLKQKSIKDYLTPSQTPHRPKSQIDKTAELKNKVSAKYEKCCPICLEEYSHIKGSLQCSHQFCFDCLQKWCESSTICPCCRKQFTSIVKLTKASDGSVQHFQNIKVEKKLLECQTQYDHYICYQCASGEDEHILLICDQCDFYCCHVYCDPDLNGIIPRGNWYCIYCKERRKMRREQNRRSRGRRQVYFPMPEVDLQQLLDYDFDPLSGSDLYERPNQRNRGVSSRTRSNQPEGALVRTNAFTMLRSMRRQVR